MFNYRVNLGSDTNPRTKIGLNSLLLIERGGYIDPSKKLTKDYQLDININDHFRRSALHFHARNRNYQLFQYFLNLDNSIYQRTSSGQNCFLLVPEEGYLGLCKRLTEEKKFNINITDNYGKSALHYCTRKENYQFFQYFVNLGSNINQRTRNGQNCLLLAEEGGYVDICKSLIEEYNFDVNLTDNSGTNALHYCTGKGNYELFQYFVNMGIDINYRTNNGQNCLLLAAGKGNMDLCERLTKEYNFDINLTDNSGKSVLHCSAEKGYYELFQYFFGLASDTTKRTKNGQNCLHLAANRGYMEFCKKLTEEYTFDINITDNSGKSALHYCARNGSCQFFEYFLNLGSDINQRTTSGQNCLHLAAEGGYMDLCKKLTDKYKFDINITDNSGKSALHYCIGKENYQLFDYLVEMGSDINLRTKDGRNCLHLAAEKGHLDLCKKLADKYNIDINITDNSGKTALHYCTDKKNMNYFSILSIWEVISLREQTMVKIFSFWQPKKEMQIFMKDLQKNMISTST